MENERKHELLNQFPGLNELANHHTVLWENTNREKKSANKSFFNGGS